MVGSMCLSGTIPLFFELVCDSAYPVAEGVTNSLMVFLSNVTSFVILLILMIPMGKINGSSLIMYLVKYNSNYLLKYLRHEITKMQ